MDLNEWLVESRGTLWLIHLKLLEHKGFSMNYI